LSVSRSVGKREMKPDRKTIDVALKQVTVPHLRELGFKGSYPNFYRDRGNHIDLLTFQFRREGGSFAVEVSFADPARQNIYIYKDSPVKALRPSQATERLRLGSNPGAGVEDFWFSFEPHGVFHRTPSPESVADQVVSHIKTQGLMWWDLKKEETETANNHVDTYS